MKYTLHEVYDHITKGMCVEFIEENTFLGRKLNAVYYVFINGDGDLVYDRNNAVTALTYTVDATEWGNDDSPERFYDEFETLSNQEFCKLLSRMVTEINEAIGE